MFHKNQIQAIQHTTGPAMVLAGPGSGKTTVIVERVKNLIKAQIPPEKILVVTFTKTAANHMKKRFFVEMEMEMESTYPVTFGTFHSVFFHILQEEYEYRSRTVISERQKIEYIKQCMIRLKIETLSINDYLYSAVNEIGKVKTNGGNIEEYESPIFEKDEFYKIYQAYETCLKLEHKMDFDDIIRKTYDIFCNYPKILRKWQQTFEYILIDEFQDINLLQYKVVRLLAAPANNLFVVGDDDQSIYGFRGSKPDIILHFKEDYEATKTIILNNNYRSSDKIVQVANRLIVHNQVRYPKHIQAVKSGGTDVLIRKFKNQGEEIAFIIRQIQDLLRNHISADEIAVLLRHNSQIPAFQMALNNNGIANHSKHLLNPEYSQKVLRDILAYIYAALSFKQIYLNENLNLLSILNKPQRYIGTEVILQKEMTLERLKEAYAHNMQVYYNIQNLEFHLKMIAILSPYAAINYIRKGVGYEEYLLQYAKEHRLKPKFLFRHLETIHQDAYEYESFEKWFHFVEQKRETKPIRTEGVRLLTMHSAKGLEFHTVIIPDANQGIIPSKKILREKEFEEERRIFYVAMTRAKNQLCIYGTMEYLGNPLEMSMFVGEMF